MYMQHTTVVAIGLEWAALVCSLTATRKPPPVPVHGTLQLVKVLINHPAVQMMESPLVSSLCRQHLVIMASRPSRASTYPEGVIVRKCLSLKVNRCQSPVVSVLVDRKNQKIVLKDLSLSCPASHFIVVVAAAVGKELCVKERVEEVCLWEVRVHLVVPLKQLQVEVDDFIIEPLSVTETQDLCTTDGDIVQRSRHKFSKIPITREQAVHSFVLST